jgi:hypothetical protein
MSQVRRRLGVLVSWMGLFGVSVLGCGGDPNAPDAGCDGPVLLGASAGLEPSFSWLPNCGVHNLIVLQGVGPHPFGQQAADWAVESEPGTQGLPNNRLHSSIRYGAVPSGGRQLVAPVPLVAGQPYTVYLNVYTSEQRTETVGSRTFTP